MRTRGRPPKPPESERLPPPRPVIPDEENLSLLVKARLERVGKDAIARRLTPPGVWAELAVLMRRLGDEPGARDAVYQMRVAKARAAYQAAGRLAQPIDRE